MLDLEHYLQIVDNAKKEFSLINSQGLNVAMNNNPIKTRRVKRANREREEDLGKPAVIIDWSKSALNKFFPSKAL